jgi:threonine/homoserine/homoserine lactone efflux protein
MDSLMIGGTLFVATFLFAVTMTTTPGPNNIMLLASSLNYGARQTIPHGLGIVCGVPLMVASVGIGLGHVFESFPVFHQVIKLLGVSYLLYLAWKVVVAKPASPGREGGGRPLTFFQAVLFQWVNPKSWVSSIGAVSAFMTVGSDVLREVMVIAMAFLFVAMISTSIWIFCGYLLDKLLTNDIHRRLFNIVMAFLLVITILPIFGTIYY